jgi:hypothetical protein
LPGPPIYQPPYEISDAESFPIGDKWSVIVRNDSANPVVLVVCAVCAKVDG